VHYHAHEQKNGKIRFALRLSYTPSSLKNNGKYEGINNKQEKRVEERPKNAHDGPLVSPDYIPLGQLQN
jgi:hypothetical protein